jgi:sugar/nucleoside kinase (ribokinase family)
MTKVLFVGDVNADLILGGLARLPEADREIPCREMRLTIGSPAAIAACAFASLGGEASLCGLAGADTYGEFMLEGLADFGVGASLVRTTGSVGTGLTVCLIVNGQRAQVTYPGTIAAFDGSWLTDEALRGFEHLHLAGVYQQTAFLPRIASVLQRAKQLGVTTSLDPQWDVTEQWEGMDAWLPLLDQLFVNEAEACSMTGAPDAEAACRALAERTACPIIKIGARGALIRRDGAVTRAAPFAAKLIDTTGAGDSLAAGTLFALKQLGRPLAEAVRFGNAVGARCCGFLGGVAARSSCEDILNYMKEHG